MWPQEKLGVTLWEGDEQRAPDSVPNCSLAPQLFPPESGYKPVRSCSRGRHWGRGVPDQGLGTRAACSISSARQDTAGSDTRSVSVPLKRDRTRKTHR